MWFKFSKNDKVDIILSNKEKCQQGATQVKNAV